MSAPPSIRQQAESLAAEGRGDEAVVLLEERAAAGDGEALFALGTWLGTGRLLERDMVRARDCFERAASEGHDQAEVISINFLGNGTGGPRDWPAAVKRLEARGKVESRARFEADLLSRMTLDSQGDPLDAPAGKTVSESPHVELFPDLFSQAECAYLAIAAGPFLRPATVVDNASGKAIRNPIRTSETAVLTAPLENLVVQALNRRLAAATRTSVEQGEPLQVLRYHPGQEYKTHIDAIPSLDNQRVLTALVYLNEGYEGGETQFIATGMAVRGKTGLGLVFRNVDADGRPDKRAAHCGRPVTGGVKLLASRWIRERAFLP